jgi:hypothetical protein
MPGEKTELAVYHFFAIWITRQTLYKKRGTGNYHRQEESIGLPGLDIAKNDKP